VLKTNYQNGGADVSELALGAGLNQNDLSLMLDRGKIDFWIEAKFVSNLIDVVEWNNAGKFPTKFLQNQKFPILKRIFYHHYFYNFIL